MPLDPDRLRELNEGMNTLSKRLDALIECHKNDSDDDDDFENEEEEELEDPAEEAMNATPNLDLDNPNSPDNFEPWWS